jgi:GNAT superfamily N-acetyltransferase
MHLVTVTYLEMLSPAALKPKRCPDPRFRVDEATVNQWEYNRFLYHLVGSNWTWVEKNHWTDQQWQEYAESKRLRTFVAYYDASVAGYYELRQDKEGGIEIAIFGLAPQFVGHGYGGVLLTHAVEEAWRPQPKRVWLHTCSLDHPAALPNYQKRGFTLYKTGTRPPPGDSGTSGRLCLHQIRGPKAENQTSTWLGARAPTPSDV